MQIGERVRELRKLARWSLRKLEQESGVDKSSINRIEHGKAGYDIRIHEKLARAFGLTLPEFHQGIGSRDDGTQPQQSTSIAAESAVYVYDEKASAAILVPQVMDKKMLPQLITLQPGGKTHVEQNRPDCEKILFVVEGKVEAKVGEERHLVERARGRYGILYFKGSKPHRLTNLGKRVARCFMVTTPVEL